MNALLEDSCSIYCNCIFVNFLLTRLRPRYRVISLFIEQGSGPGTDSDHKPQSTWRGQGLIALEEIYIE